MEQNEISVHEVRMFVALLESGAWMTSKQVARLARVAERTARAHLRKFTHLGLCDVAEIFPGHRYRWSDKAGKRNAAYLIRLENAHAAVAGDLQCESKGPL